MTTWSPLGGGVLSGKYRSRAEEGRRSRGGGPIQAEDGRARAVLDAVSSVADGLGASPAQVAIAWVRQQPWRPIPILGARTVEQLRSNLRALDLVLDDDPSPGSTQRARSRSDSRTTRSAPRATSARSPADTPTCSTATADPPFLTSPMEPS